MTTATTATVIGRDAHAFGRVFRLVSGALLVTAGAVGLATGPAGWTLAAPTLGWLVGLVVFYLLLYRVIVQRISERVDPFVATVLVLGPLGVLGLSVFPRALHDAVGLYVGASLILTAGAGYGGCEVVALSVLLWRRRSVVYCPINILDAAERPLHRTGDRWGQAAAGLALVVAGWFLIASPILDHVGASDPVSRWWALLLVLPAALLAVRAWRCRDRGWSRLSSHLLGSAALVAGAVVLVGWVSQSMVFAAAVLVGLVVAAIRLVAGLIDRHPRTQARGPGDDVR